MSITENLHEIRNRIAAHGTQATLIAVSKTYPVAAIAEAYAAGQRHFGENRVQELEEKAPQLPNDIVWHLIGPLQANKAAKAVHFAAYIHAVDSLKLLERIDRLAGTEGKVQNVMIEVNVTGEVSKSGIAPDELIALLEASRGLQHLHVCGLMTMAEFGAAPERLHETFAALRQLRDTAQNACAMPLPELSMGMSGDFETALDEGATFVRIGTAIFGARSTPAN